MTVTIYMVDSECVQACAEHEIRSSLLFKMIARKYARSVYFEFRVIELRCYIIASSYLAMSFS